MSKLRDQYKPISDTLLGKLPNRRIKAKLMKDGTINFNFKRLCEDGEIHCDGIRLSLEALNAMVVLTRELIARVNRGNYDKSRLSQKEWEALCFGDRPNVKLSVIRKHG